MKKEAVAAFKRYLFGSQHPQDMERASPWSLGSRQPYTQVRLVNTDSLGVSLKSPVNEETKHSEQC